MAETCQVVPENVVTNCYCLSGDLAPLVRKLVYVQGDNLLEVHISRNPFSSKYSVKIVTGGVADGE